jgi:superfamily II helicase
MISDEWKKCAKSIIGGGELSDFQIDAINAVTTSRKNILIDGPPSTGKTVMGFIALFHEIKKGNRGVLIEPLRVLVEEKYKILNENKDIIEQLIGPFKLSYKMGGSLVDFNFEEKELLITTPEYYLSMDNSIIPGIICVDEAQMINSPRGRSLIKIINRSQVNGENSRIVLMGHNLDHVWENWLHPSVTIKGKSKMESSIVWMGNVFQFENIVNLLHEIFEKEENSQVLIFVSQVRFTISLVEKLKSVLSEEITGESGPQSFYGKLDNVKKTQIRQSVENRKCNIVVATTALLQGVDLPFTHVIIRDISIPSRGSLTDEEILQLAGRAGRRGKKGRAFVLRKKPGRGWKKRLKKEEGAFITLTGYLSGKKATWEEIEENILNKPWFLGNVSILTNLMRKLSHNGIIFRQDEGYSLTPYGETISKSLLPLDTLIYWNNFWENCPKFQYSKFDKLLVYACATGEGTSLNKGSMVGVKSVLWDRWLKDGLWDLFFSTMGKKVVNPQKSGQRAVSIALKHLEYPRSESLFYQGFSNLEKSGKRVWSK